MTGPTEIRTWLRPGDGATVVFCNGMGMPLELWHPVVERLPEEFGLVLYDRPVDAPHRADDLDEQMAEIDDVLLVAESAGVSTSGPLILVGHSYGGVLAEAYARRRPRRVAGLVLADAAVPAEYAGVVAAAEDDDGGELPWWRNAAINLSDVAALRPILSWLFSAGMVATATRQQTFSDAVKALPEGAAQRIVSSDNVTRAMVDDHWLPLICAGLLEDRQGSGPLRIPTIILVGASGPRAWPSQPRSWVTAQRSQARDISTTSAVQELPGAHLLMLDVPDAVAAAIHDVADMLELSDGE